jgi:glycosyltransferase involved in cell wall biosynthesis
MRTAIVHYWLMGMRGGEKVVETLCRMLPDADLFTLFYDPERVSETIRSHQVTASFLQPARRFYRSLLPLMPFALESLDLRGYDLVISSESGPAKGVLVPAHARHVCYCHTPMRYLWELYPAYRNDWTRSRIKRAILTAVSPWLRTWDYSSAARVDEFIANSDNVRQRIWRTYRRESTVIYPPVAVSEFCNKPSEDYHLIVSELVAYKRVEDAVRACAKTGRKLRVVGDGPDYKELRNFAGPTIEFCGRVSDAELRDLYARCVSVLMPGEEDFGIVMVEALASGKPVVALGRGGAREIVPVADPFGGILYAEPGEEYLIAALHDLESRLDTIRPDALRAWARRFSEEEFDTRMRDVLFGLPRAASR